ncbi:helix-turn-helix domain-containing protein [Streptomyces armeniacus]|uniref:Helix-turn-helix domain-containing protein n=1 Tax=Streptomyces armeniacus TaxID=83291 RepID=A0A345XM33_9ACTN|nr:helix-turn-helix domain-containing protein [Streptomyces armeniacus]AXK32699.1 helix-turn-helix domain-containing protein [Streptomyces armeniacus]
MRSENGTTAVAVLALPRAYALDVSIATHVFGRHPDYRVFVCGAHDPGAAEGTGAADGTGGGTAAGTGGGPPYAGVAAEIRPTHPLAGAEDADVVVVPGYEDPQLPVPGEYLRALRAAVERGARVVAVCTGVFALAAGGLLKGKSATTHWRHTGQLRALYPEIDVVENRLFVEDGTFLTSAGGGAGIDACLHIVQTDFGAAVADGVAKEVVFSTVRGSDEPQYADVPTPPRESLRATREWVLENIGSAITVQRMADHSLLSRRTFNRRFARETGMPPMRWVARQRILHARRLLEASDWSVERIAAAAGFGTAANFRTVFRREVGVTPTAYRASYGPAAGPASQGVTP